jgi:hypothetical protein
MWHFKEKTTLGIKVKNTVFAGHYGNAHNDLTYNDSTYNDNTFHTQYV